MKYIIVILSILTFTFSFGATAIKPTPKLAKIICMKKFPNENTQKCIKRILSL